MINEINYENLRKTVLSSQIFRNNEIIPLCTQEDSIDNIVKLDILIKYNISNNIDSKKNFNYFNLKLNNKISRHDILSYNSINSSFFLALTFNLILTKNTGTFMMTYGFLDTRHKTSFFLISNLLLSSITILIVYNKLRRMEQQIRNKYTLVYSN